MHSRTRWERNVSLRAGWFKSPSHLNKGPLCQLKFFLYSPFIPPTLLSLTHLWSMTVTRSLGKRASFLGSANSLIACTSLGLACGRRQKRNDVTCRKVLEQQSLLWFFFFLNEKDKKSFRPLPPSRWAGQSWVCLQDCMPSTFALQRIAPEGNRVASPGARPPALHAIISRGRVNVSDAYTLSHRACQKNKQHKGGDTHSKHEWQIPCLACTQIQKKHGVSVLTSDYLPARQTKPGLFTIGKHLPESDTKHPHVWGKGERADAKTLWSTPGEKRGRQIRSKRKSYWCY